MIAQARTTTARGDLPPGELSRLTAEYLEAAGITVTPDGPGPDPGLRLHPGPAPRPRERPGEAGTARWSLIVDDNARARLNFTPAGGSTADPLRIADIAAALLTGTFTADSASADVPGPAPGGGILRAAGLDLRRRGFTVELCAFADNESLELSADLSVTAPGDDPDDPATVYISDDGAIQFDRPYWADHAADEWEPDYRAWLPDPAACARAIAGTVTAAIAAARAGRRAG